jgi:hypothetical protein
MKASIPWFYARRGDRDQEPVQARSPDLILCNALLAKLIPQPWFIAAPLQTVAANHCG